MAKVKIPFTVTVGLQTKRKLSALSKNTKIPISRLTEEALESLFERQEYCDKLTDKKSKG